MRLKLKFSESKIPFTYPTQNAVNSCIHRILGENNKYHNSFSNYCVSSLFGGVIVDNKMTYPNGAHFYVSSLDEELIEKIMFSVINGNVEYPNCNPIWTYTLKEENGTIILASSNNSMAEVTLNKVNN